MSDSKWYFAVVDDLSAILSNEDWSTIERYAIDGWIVVSKDGLDRLISDHAEKDVRWLFNDFPRNFVYGGALSEYVASYETEILHYFDDDHTTYIKFWYIFNKESIRMSREQFNENLLVRLDKLTDQKLSKLTDRQAFFDYMMKTMVTSIRN